MDEDLTTRQMPPKHARDHTPAWEVRYRGEVIGWLEQWMARGRASRSTFYRASVLVDGQTIPMGSSIYFDEECLSILEAWRDPAGCVHTRYWLKLPKP